MLKVLGSALRKYIIPCEFMAHISLYRFHSYIADFLSQAVITASGNSCCVPSELMRSLEASFGSA